MSADGASVDPPSEQRLQVLADVLELILATAPRQRSIVGIDGPDGVGKSTLTAQLCALAPMMSDRQVVPLAVDGFHHPRALRYAHGRDATSYFEHAFNYPALCQELQQFRDGLPIRTAIHDVTTDAAVDCDPQQHEADAVLLVEGVFLQRAETIGYFDAVLAVQAPLSVTVPRGNARFARPATEDDPDHPANARYVQAHRRYAFERRRDGVLPTWIFDNTDTARPELITPDPEYLATGGAPPR